MCPGKFVSWYHFFYTGTSKNFVQIQSLPYKRNVKKKTSHAILKILLTANPKFNLGIRTHKIDLIFKKMCNVTFTEIYTICCMQTRMTLS